MACVTLISPTTAAVTTSAVLETQNYDSIVLHADGLAAAEEVDVYILGGQTEVLYPGSASPAKLTATAAAITLPPGPTYGIRKDATVGACGVYASVSPKQ